ncbi:MAG: type II secretion system GspH family protein [Kiritimatiellales bacterium]|nr:type II secretion system GspH family protein [Kiritimatiellales bacterium]
MNKQRSAFTLLEIMIVLGILGILATIVMIAINPTKQLSEARGANRHASVREIENAVIQYIIDGNSFAGLPSGKINAQDICRTGITGTCYDLAVLSPTYLTSLPVDPDETDPDLTGYRIHTLGSFIKVCSPRVDVDCGS